MKVLITGGCGYLGGGLVDIFLKDGNHNITVYDNPLYEESYRKDVNFVYGDIRNYNKLLPLIKESDCVIWLASLVGDGVCAINPEETIDINVNTVKWLANNYDGKIIYPSSCSVYGASHESILDENSTTNPLSLYASAKLECEKILENKDALIFRLGTLFGVGDLFSRIRMDLVVNVLTMKALTTGKLTVFGGEQYRPLLHCKSVAQMMFDSINSKNSGVYNLHKENVRIIDIANKIQSILPCEIEKTEISFQDARNYRANSNKAKTDLNFNPVLSLEDGINEVATLIKEGRVKNPMLNRYSNADFIKCNEGLLDFNGKV